MAIDIEAFRDDYCKAIESIAKGDSGAGVYPQPVVFVLRSGQPEAVGIHNNSTAVYQHVEAGIRRLGDELEAVAFGVDRVTAEGQGTTRRNVFTFVVAKRGEQPSWGVVEYDGIHNGEHESAVCDPPSWDNWHWRRTMRREVWHHAPSFKAFIGLS